MSVDKIEYIEEAVENMTDLPAGQEISDAEIAEELQETYGLSPEDFDAADWQALIDYYRTVLAEGGDLGDFFLNMDIQTAAGRGFVTQSAGPLELGFTSEIPGAPRTIDPDTDYFRPPTLFGGGVRHERPEGDPLFDGPQQGLGLLPPPPPPPEPIIPEEVDLDGDGDSAFDGTDAYEIITAGDGDDTISGGGGDDTLNFGTELRSGDQVDGGDGYDVLSYTDSNGNRGNELNNVTNIERIELGEANTKVTSVDDLVAAGEQLVIDGSGLGTSKLSFDGRNETDGSFDIVSAGGKDTLRGGSQDDVFQSGDNNDLLYGYGGSDSLVGDGGNDKLYGDIGNDTLYGGADNDSLYGGADNDVLVGGAGNDLLKGDDGDDTFIVSASTDALNDKFDGGGGVDVISVEADTLFVDNATFTRIEEINIANNGGIEAADDRQVFNFSGVDLDGVGYIDGNGGNDQITGSDLSNDRILGGTGNDKLYGKGGSDSLYGNEDNDSLYGGDGNDLLDGGAGNDLLKGDDGDDTFTVSASTDALNDKFDGGGGVDVINVEADTFYVDNATFTRIEEINIAGNGGIEAADDRQVFNFASVDLDDVGYIDGNGGNDQITGSDLSDDRIFGGEGNDKLYGRDGNDSLFGDAGNDTIQGGAGNDLITGGIGADNLRGDDGSDTFHYNSLAEGGDIVSRFVSGEDGFTFDASEFDATAGFFSGKYKGYDGSEANTGSDDASFIFDERTGELWYDDNGDDAGGHTLIADVSGDDVEVTDITIV